MGWDHMLRTLDNCRRMCASLGRKPYFYLTGGDPILHRDFWRLLALLKDEGVGFSLLGNPFHLDDAVCEKLRSLGCDRYQLSIDGLERTHDAIRKPGSFAATLEKIGCINRAGITSMLMTTVSGANIDEIPDIVDLAVAQGAAVHAFARYCPPGPEGGGNRISPAKYRALLQACWSKFEEHKGANTVFNLKDHLWTLFLHEQGLYSIPPDLDRKIIYDGCNCGISHLSILPDGEVYACRRMPSPVGNALTDELAEVFLGERMDAYRDFGRFEKCSKCELLRFCRGCPAVAHAYTGSHFSPDPQCWKHIPASRS